EWQQTLSDPPMLMFDNIKGYPQGYRAITNLFSTPRRAMSALGLPEASGIKQVTLIRNKLNESFELLPPVEAITAPVKENILRGDEIDLYKFPTPKWHLPMGAGFSALVI
ncbi:hypothetical protein ACFLYL_04085, partial [Chloroflexota bacterium]